MITRREFGQWLVGTFVLVGNNLLPLGCARRKEELLADVTWKKGVCRFCGTGCGVLVGVRDGKVVALQGDRDNPVNRGLLCVKGYHALEILYGHDRLKKPLIHKDGKPVEASWDEALDLVAGKFKEAIEKHGPESVAFYGSGQWTVQEGYAALKLMKAGIGSNNLECNARLCMASAVTGFMTTFGSDEPMGCYDDFERADVFVMWGNNMAETHPVLFSRITETKRQRPSVKIVDIATRRTRTTEHADLYLEFIPQTDLALANGIAHLLIAQGKINRDFIAKHAVFKRGKTNIGYGLEDGFAFDDEAQEATLEQFTAFLADYAPERVSKLSGVPVESIRQLADLYGDPNKKVVSLWTMGMNQHTRGTWINNLVHNLHLL
ncbi:MAG: periplasmic nitrate reductase subunit alpha, partial [Planctomycetes bacterium]|nr:periplasmic nitrate reductase subunit alpha [Planctomycetota bacterium]